MLSIPNFGKSHDALGSVSGEVLLVCKPAHTHMSLQAWTEGCAAYYHSITQL